MYNKLGTVTVEIPVKATIFDQEEGENVYLAGSIDLDGVWAAVLAKLKSLNSSISEDNLDNMSMEHGEYISYNISGVKPEGKIPVSLDGRIPRK